MKIGVSARLLLKQRMEGICRYIYETSRRMVADHPEDTFYFFFDRPYDPSFVFADNVIPVVVPPPTRHPVLSYIWLEWMLPRAMKKYGLDVFYAGDTYMSLASNVPTVLVCHDIAYAHFPEQIPFIARKHYAHFFPLFHKKAASVVAVSDFTKKDIIRQYDLDANKVHVGHNACPEGFAPADEAEKKKIREQYSDGRPYFVYLGSVHPRKNVHGLIEGFSLFKSKYNTDHQLLIIGRKAWKVDVIEQAYDNSLFKSDIHFLGSLGEESKKIVAAAEAMVYVSFFEGFGIPVLEAMQSGVPVITSSISSMPEVAGEAGILVGPNKKEEIAEAMFKISSDDTLRTNLIKKGLKQVQSFSWQTTTEIIYEELRKAHKSKK